jgi:hypothetical protein
MYAAKAQKFDASDIRHPLQQTGILQRVLDYVGPGHWLFVAEVSSLWRELYLKVADREIQVNPYIQITCVPQMTMLSAVFGSPEQVRLAHAHGLLCTTGDYQMAAGMHANIATLKAAHELGMPYDYTVIEGAARCNSLAVVHFLHDQGCPVSRELFRTVAGRGNTILCVYLHAAGCPWDASACAMAACNGHVSTLRWLHEHGCPWDARTIHSYAAEGDSVDVLEYLQQQGGIEFTAAKLTDMLKTAVALNKLAAAQWLREQGAE